MSTSSSISAFPSSSSSSSSEPKWGFEVCGFCEDNIPDEDYMTCDHCRENMCRTCAGCLNNPYLCKGCWFASNQYVKLVAEASRGTLTEEERTMWEDKICNHCYPDAWMFVSKYLEKKHLKYKK